MTKLNKNLLNILVCPVSKGKLVYDEEKNELICEESKLAYPIIDGIPAMLKEKARKIL
ncbi:MAG: hypothetical protein CMC84_00065 [Flavobacteriaceae bacterium]|nr:hypothetical protein [Flavobacteriaceae bacterium]|tara:strand:+ start:8778 stop:8951 length:174 start_codon:yes stop_codon:yes gene_type:complete